MLPTNTTHIHGLHTQWSNDGLEVRYVFPGALATQDTEALPNVGAQRVFTLGVMTADPDGPDGTRVRDDKFWRWEAKIQPATRIWARHVLAAEISGKSSSYDHEGQIVLVWANLPALEHEIELLQGGFSPALATWRAPNTTAARALASRMEQVPPRPAPRLMSGRMPTELRDDFEQAARAEHAWMRWAARMDNRFLKLAEHIYQYQRPPRRDGSRLILNYVSPTAALQLVLDVARHPLIYDVTALVEKHDGRVERTFPAVAWEDFDNLVTEIATIANDTSAAQRAAPQASRALPGNGGDARAPMTLRIQREATSGFPALDVEKHVSSLEEASHEYRLVVEASREGASTFPDGQLLLPNGQTYRISYNGRVWDGKNPVDAHHAGRPGEPRVADAARRTVKSLPDTVTVRLAAPAEAVRFEDARSALKALGLPPKKYAYYLRRAEEAIEDGKGWAPVVARARRVAEKLSGVSTPAKSATKQPKERPAVRIAAIDVTLDSFNGQPGWRAQQVRPRANGFVLAIFPEGRAMDAAVASIDVVDGEIDEVRWLEERLTQSVRDVITDRLDRALWDAFEDAEDDDDTDPRPSPLQDLIELMDRRSLALGARAANTADLGRKDGYANIAIALRDLARPTGPTAEDLQRWLETAELMSAGEVVGRARGAEPTSVRQIMRDLWAAVFEVLARDQVAGRPGSLRLPAEAIFHDDDNAGDFVLQRVHQGEREVLRRIRVRVGELDEDTDEVRVEDPSGRLASGDTMHRADRPEQFFVDLYGKLGTFHDDLERAPRTLQDVRTLLYWAAVMLDAPLCQGDVKARATIAFTQAKAFHDTARRALTEGRSVDAVRRMHEALTRISTAAAEIARSCGEGQMVIAVTPPHLPVLPADRAAIDGITGTPGPRGGRSDEPMRPPPAATVTNVKHLGAELARATMSGVKPTHEQLRERFAEATQVQSKSTMPTYYIFRTKSGRPELLTRADIEARARAAVGDVTYDEAERNPMPGADLFSSAVGAVELAMDAKFEGRADPRWAASTLAGRPSREPEFYIFRTRSGLPELLTREDIEARARAIVGDDAYRQMQDNPMPGANTFEAAVNIVEESLQAQFEGRADPQWASSIQWEKHGDRGAVARVEGSINTDEGG